MTTRHRFRRLFVLCALLFLAACGGRQESTRKTPLALLQDGAYREAYEQISSKERRDPDDLALLSLTTIAMNPGRNAAIKAVNILTGSTSEVESAVAATRMLGHGFLLPAPMADQIGILLCETALGAAGHGSLSQSNAQPESGSQTAAELALAVLERLNIWLSTTAATASRETLVAIWNGSYSLLGASMEFTDDEKAWRLFTSLGGITLATWQPGRRNSFSDALINATIEVVERNTQISVAVKCDLSSPYERLRQKISSNMELLGRLERSVAAATGCSKGRYAPGPTQ